MSLKDKLEALSGKVAGVVSQHGAKAMGSLAIGAGALAVAGIYSLGSGDMMGTETAVDLIKDAMTVAYPAVGAAFVMHKMENTLRNFSDKIAEKFGSKQQDESVQRQTTGRFDTSQAFSGDVPSIKDTLRSVSEKQEQKAEAGNGMRSSPSMG